MSVTIDKFVTRCRVPKQHQAVGSLANNIARQRFASECSRRLSVMPASQANVVRIRRLPLQLKITTAKLDEETITRAWVDTFIKELSLALNSTRLSENEIVCTRTRAEWLARFIADVVSGSAQSRWEYEEFKEDLQLSTADSVLSVLAREPSEALDVLLSLEDRKLFDQFLLLFDELGLEKLLSLLAHQVTDETRELTIDDLLTIGALLPSQKSTRVNLATRQRALRIFLALTKSQQVEDRAFTPRLVLHTLMALDTLAELTQSLPLESWFHALAPETLALREPGSLHPVVLEALAKVWTLAAQIGLEVPNHQLESLAQLLSDLSPVPVVVSANAEKRAHWVSSECAGLMLLVGLIDRLGWVQRIRISSVGSRLDSRATNFCLAALSLRLLGKSPESERYDPGLLLFAGWLEPAVADLNGFRNFLDSLSAQEQDELVDLLTDTAERHRFEDWVATFDHLAGNLIQEFSSRVRGFRKANPAFVIKSFFSQPGRIFIDDKRILVVLQANPFHIALHISSMDESVDSVSWMAGRRLEFQLEGL